METKTSSLKIASSHILSPLAYVSVLPSSFLSKLGIEKMAGGLVSRGVVDWALTGIRDPSNKANPTTTMGIMLM